MTDVCLQVWGDHDDVIEVDQQCLPVEPTQSMSLCSMSLWKVAKGGGQPKGQHLPLPQFVPSDERRLLLGVVTQRDLPIPAQRVYSTKVLAAGQGIQGFINPR